MSKTVKRVGIVVVALVLLLAIGVGVFLARLDGLVADTVRTQATKQLNLQTDLSSASVSVLGGHLGLNELKIASPQGFSAPQMFSLGKADVQVGYGQLRQDPVHVASITLDKPTLVIEQKDGTFNFKKAIDDMPKGDPKPTDGGDSAPKPAGDGKPKPADDGKPPLKLIIDALTIKDARVIVRPNLPGLAQEITVPVSTFTMKNIGSGDGSQNGAAVKDVAQQVITALVAQAHSSNLLPDALKGILGGNLSDVVNQLGAQAKQRLAQALPGEAGKMIGDLAADPQALLKNPGQALGQLGQKLGGGNGIPTTIPGVPADAGKAAGDLLKGLGGGKKDKKDKK